MRRAHANMAAGVADPGAARRARRGRVARVRRCGPLDPAEPSGCGRVSHVPLISTGLLPDGTFQFARFDSIPPAATSVDRAGAAAT